MLSKPGGLKMKYYTANCLKAQHGVLVPALVMLIEYIVELNPDIYFTDHFKFSTGI